MMNESMYSDYLKVRGDNLSEVRKYDAETVYNVTFDGSPGYKRCYILDPKKGWHWTDVKYQRHSRQNISNDDADYYISFRPHVHYPIGTYIFIPNENERMSDHMGFYDENPIDPFKDKNFDKIFNEGKLWLIVNKDNDKLFVKYMVLPCDYLFRWVASYEDSQEIFSVYGTNRVKDSSKAGTWDRNISRRLDTVTYFWIPDTHYIFGNDIDVYGLDDTRYLAHDIRMMITTNVINPKVYRVTDINEMNPQGVIKVTVKQDEYDPKTDNVNLMVCDYYNSTGEVQISENIEEIPTETEEDKTAEIYWGILNDRNELEIDTTALLSDEETESEEIDKKYLSIGSVSYFIAETSTPVDFLDWRIEYSESNDDYVLLDEEDLQHFNDLISISKLSENTASVKPAKTKKLIGKKYYITVQTPNGEYKARLEVEVNK